MTNLNGIIYRLREASELCHNHSLAAGWWDVAEPKKLVVATKLCLIHSEVSEALEAYRKQKADDKLPHRPGIEVELADTLIRIFDLAGFLQLDLGGAFAEKLEYNKNRKDHTTEAREKENGKKF